MNLAVQSINLQHGYRFLVECLDIYTRQWSFVRYACPVPVRMKSERDPGQVSSQTMAWAMAFPAQILHTCTTNRHTFSPHIKQISTYMSKHKQTHTVLGIILCTGKGVVCMQISKYTSTKLLVSSLRVNLYSSTTIVQNLQWCQLSWFWLCKQMPTQSSLVPDILVTFLCSQ